MSCYINAMGLICNAGRSPRECYQNIMTEQYAPFDVVDCLSSKRPKRVGRVNWDLPEFPEELQRFYSRTNHLALAAVSQIKPELEMLKAVHSLSRIGVIVGTCTSGATEIDRTRELEKETGSMPEGYDYSVEFMDNTAEFVAAYLGLPGTTLSVSTACTSSGKAIAMAKRYIDANILDVVVVGGADSFALTTLNGFDSLGAMSAGDCKPFSGDRDGINLGEAAAFIVLSKTSSDIRLYGAGESSDGYHMSSPEPNGLGAELAIQSALNDAKLTSRDIGYINLHGTGTEANDAMEAKLINRLFGEETPCSTIKNITGHTLGAASALELCMCISILKYSSDEYLAIPQHRDYELDNDLPPINLAGQDERCMSSLLLSTSYAFGGSNCSLVVGPGA